MTFTDSEIRELVEVFVQAHGGINLERGIRAVLDRVVPRVRERAREETLREAARLADQEAAKVRWGNLMSSPTCRADELRSFAITLRKLAAPPVTAPASAEEPPSVTDAMLAVYHQPPAPCRDEQASAESCVQLDDRFAARVQEILAEMGAEALPPDAAEVLRRDAWDLYETCEPAPSRDGAKLTEEEWRALYLRSHEMHFAERLEESRDAEKALIAYVESLIAARLAGKGTP